MILQIVSTLAIKLDAIDALEYKKKSREVIILLSSGSSWTLHPCSQRFFNKLITRINIGG